MQSLSSGAEVFTFACAKELPELTYANRSLIWVVVLIIMSIRDAIFFSSNTTLLFHDTITKKFDICCSLLSAAQLL
jgi:hypothetical protein